MTARRRPTGKAERRDRAALGRLWALLYRSVRRTAVRTDQLHACVNTLSNQVDRLQDYVVSLVREVDVLRARLEDAGLVEEGEGRP